MYTSASNISSDKSAVKLLPRFSKVPNDLCACESSSKRKEARETYRAARRRVSSRRTVTNRNVAPDSATTRAFTSHSQAHTRSPPVTSSSPASGPALLLLVIRTSVSEKSGEEQRGGWEKRRSRLMFNWKRYAGFSLICSARKCRLSHSLYLSFLLPFPFVSFSHCLFFSSSLQKVQSLCCFSPLVHIFVLSPSSVSLVLCLIAAPCQSAV